MKYYSKNIFRTILQNKGSYIGATIIIAIGVLVFIAMTEFLNNLADALEFYCEQNAYADAFATVESMPRSQLEGLLDVEGVEAVFGRLEGEARLLREGGSDIVTLHLMAWSADDGMNLITLRPRPEDMADDELYIGENMAKLYGFQPGDTLTLTANGRTRRFAYAGLAYSPEQMFMLPGDDVSAPDNAIYDLGVMNTAALEGLLGGRNTVTNLGFRLEPGYRFSQVRYALRQKLEPYGLYDLCARKDQFSYSTVIEEIESYELIVTILPTIFMLVTMFILYVVLKKMVDKDRMLIGTLKAFGAGNWEIVSRYLLQGVVIGLAGGLLPILPGELAGRYLFLDDAVYYSIPYQNYHADCAVWAIGMLIAMGTALASLMLGIRDVLGIMPAESMKSAAPPGAGGLQLPQWAEKLLNRRQKIGLRAIFRNLLRSLFIALSIALPFSMISSFGSFNDVLNQTIYDQFLKAETYDLRVRLTHYVSEDAAQAMLRKFDGVRAAETAASYPVELTCRNRSEGAILSIMAPDAQLLRIMDIDDQFIEPRDDGLILSEGLARKLNVRVGDMMEVRGGSLTPDGRAAQIPVVRLARVGFGSGCYLSRDGIEHFFGTRYRPNSLLLAVEDGQMGRVKEQVNKLDGISFAVESARMLHFSAYMMETTVLMLNLLAVFSLLAGVIMIYNIINISMRERRNEFGTLLVLGMRKGEIREIIVFEQTINFVVGILLGFPFSKIICRLIEYAVATDTLCVEMRIRPVTYLATFGICAAATMISVFFVIRGVLDIQLTEVLKARD